MTDAEVVWQLTLWCSFREDLFFRGDYAFYLLLSFFVVRSSQRCVWGTKPQTS